MKSKKQVGFTIVELLIVIVVIGILAAIVIVAFNGVQNRAHDTAIESDLASLAKKMEVYRTDADVYPLRTPTDLDKLDFKATHTSYKDSQNNLYYCVTDDRKTYAVGAVSRSNQGYILTNGKVTKQSGGVYGAQTCGAISHSGSAYSGFDSAATTDEDKWADWTK